MQCPECLFHMDNHIYQVRCVTFVEKVLRWHSSSKNIYKKTLTFLASCGRYQNTMHLLQNPKLPRNTMGFNNRNLSHKTLEDEALAMVQNSNKYKGPTLMVLSCKDHALFL